MTSSNVLIFLFLTTITITKNMSPPSIEKDCLPLIGVNLNWFYQLPPKTHPQKCLQIIYSQESTNELTINCLMQQLVPFNYSFYVRSVAAVAANTLNNTQPTLAYKYCPHILLRYSNRIFSSEGCSNHGNDCQRFYPHSIVMAYGVESEQLIGDLQLEYILNNALHLVLTLGDFTNGLIQNALSAEKLPWGSQDETKINKFLDTFRAHPLFGNDPIVGTERRQPFRISFFECPPYVMLGNTSNEEGYTMLLFKWRIDSNLLVFHSGTTVWSTALWQR